MVGIQTNHCELCISRYMNYIIEMETFFKDILDCEASEILMLIGDEQSEENVYHMVVAMQRL